MLHAVIYAVVNAVVHAVTYAVVHVVTQAVVQIISLHPFIQKMQYTVPSSLCPFLPPCLLPSLALLSIPNSQPTELIHIIINSPHRQP